MSDREGRSFLEAICANPDDDTTRLVYADWLDENGQAERAEFIRNQIESAALPDWDAKRVRLQARERVLLSAHEKDWRADLPAIKHVSWGGFRRGFVASATFASFTTFRDSFGKCRAATPVESADIRWPRSTERRETLDPITGLRELTIRGRFVHLADIDRLTDAPLLSTVRVLNVLDAALGPDGFRRLIDSPHLGSLTTLRAPQNNVGNGAIDTLTRATTLPALAELDLAETGAYGRYNEDPIIDANGADALAQWPGLARLRALTLSGNDLRGEGLRLLLQSRHITGLKCLTVRDNALLGFMLSAFRDANPALQLDVLNIGENVLQDSGAELLSQAMCLRTLKALQIDRCEMGAKSATALAKAAFLPDLRILNVGFNNLGAKGLVALLGAKPAALHTLGAVGCALGDSGVAKLAESAGSDTLLDLDLGWNQIRGKGVQALGATKHLRNLLMLRLNDNPFTQRAADALKKSPLGQRLAVLELPGGSTTPPYPSLNPDGPIPF